MKRIIGIALAVFMGSVAVGAGANAAEPVNAERFVAAFGDSYIGYTYKNTMNVDKFISALEDNYKGYTYRNTMDYTKFVAALKDNYTPERYRTVMDNTRFASILKEKYADQVASANDVPKCIDEVKDYLTENLVLAKLSQACE